MSQIRCVLVLVIGLLASVAVVTAQTECPAVVEAAVAQASEACNALDRNQACYGNDTIDLTPQPDAAPVIFEAPGDTITVNDIQTLTLSPYDDTEGDDWGLALLRVQASLPDVVPGQNVTILLFGDSQLETVSDATTDAFYFQGGVGRVTCEEAPDGILIQTPDGAGTIELTINEVQITLGSTAFLTAAPEDDFTFVLLEGEATLTVEDTAVTLAAGEFSTVPLDENLAASDVPSEPQSIEAELDLPELPLRLLPRDISDDAADAESTADAASAGAIVPRSGAWTFELGEFAFEGCPSFLNEATIRDGIASFGISDGLSQDLEFGDEFDIQTLFDPGQPVDGLSYANPETNVYTVTIDIAEAGSVVYTYRIESDTFIDASIDQQLSLPTGTCSVSVAVSIAHEDN